jgi:iron(III) transport system substrate-binding protein
MTPATRAPARASAFWIPLVTLLLALGCEHRGREVVLYSSVDDYLMRDVVAAFTADTGINVRVVGDTEATKTTGLVQRLLAERRRPRADVWWSSEPFGAMRLADEGALEPYTSPAEIVPGRPWPRELRDPGGAWYAFAPRARVIVYNTRRVPPDNAPQRIADLADPRWNARVGMARPQFGTTRGHMAALAAAWGDSPFRDWLRAMKANGVRLYDGNSAVVRAVAMGEIDAGLTDTDDVWAGQREGWHVELIFEPTDQPGSAAWWSFGPLPIPNTVARVRGGPNPDAAATLIDFILSEKTERLLARSDSHNAPVRSAPAEEFKQWAIPAGRAPALLDIHHALPGAMRACDEILAGG